MDKKEKNFDTYKEFAKMFREVANIYSKLGDEPLLEEGREYNAIRDAVQAITNKHDFASYILPWREDFRSMPFNVTRQKKWADYVAECHAKGKEERAKQLRGLHTRRYTLPAGWHSCGQLHNDAGHIRHKGGGGERTSRRG